MYDHTGVLYLCSRSVVNSEMTVTLASAVQLQARNVSSLAASPVALHRTQASFVSVPRG